ncbi:Crp/Fnr family transcriptional regulator [Motiliproteus sediminis]|uniref:Crp/Fnr family transcriptional regulator n=1 Tax=Motiliproteus sediminis TaxID=1468178 RepID=UPI001AF002D2|nr:Crp/Fnr family transcriptional regulator [Motiliproteus sediminis]
MSLLVDRDAVVASLKRHYLFSSLSPSELQQLVERVEQVNLEAEQYLFRQQEPAKRFYLVADGQIKLFHTTADGHEKVVELINPGQALAEAVLFMQRPNYPVTAEAVRATRLFAIPGDAYIPLLRNNSDACMRILGDLSMRLHARLNDVVQLTQQNATHRVVRFLLGLLPSNAADGCTIYLETPKHVIASRLSVKPETLSRIMARLAQNEVIVIKGREIRVLDIDKLQNVTE